MITWSPPSSDGGSPITHYIIEQRLYSLFGISPAQDDTDWMVSVSNTSGTTMMSRIASLNPHTGYQFRVTAVNLAGRGMPSLPSTVVVTFEAGTYV